MPSKDGVVEVVGPLLGAVLSPSLICELCPDKMQTDKIPNVVEVATGTLHTSNSQKALIDLTLDSRLTSLYRSPSKPYRE